MTHWERVLQYQNEHRGGMPPVHGELGVWEAAWQAAIEEVIKEWEKPYGLTDGRSFIDRLRSMAANASLSGAPLAARPLEATVMQQTED